MVRSLYDECSTTRSDDTCVVVSLFSSSIRKYPMQQKGLFVLCTGLLLFFIFLIQRRSTWTDPTMHCPVCKNEDSSCPACPACPLPNPGYIQTPCPPPPACSCPTYSSSASVPSGFVNLGIMTSDTTNNTATLYGKQSIEKSDRWQYYAQVHDSDYKLPIIYQGKNCFTTGWPWCSLLARNDKISIVGKSGNWTLTELWGVSCGWQGNQVVCSRDSL